MTRIVKHVLYGFIFLYSLLATAHASALSQLDVRKNIYFIVHSNTAELKKGDKDSGWYELNLRHPSISFFYDRPWRVKGIATISELLAVWKANFKYYGKDAYPNATWVIEPKGQDKIGLVNVIIRDIEAEGKNLHFTLRKPDSTGIRLTIKEFKKDKIENYLNKKVEDTVFIFTLP